MRLVLLVTLLAACAPRHRVAAADQAVRFAVLGSAGAISSDTEARLDALTCPSERDAARAGMREMRATAADLGLPYGTPTVTRARVVRRRWSSGDTSAEMVVAVSYLLHDGTRETMAAPVQVRREADTWCVVPPWAGLAAVP